MLQFVFGRAACGKTHYIHNAIKQDVALKKQDIILLVPEQYTFETEREMLSLFGDGFMSMLSVLSFTRLAENAGQKYGGVAGLYVSDAERLILLGKVLKKLSAHLSLFKKYTGSTVFIRQVSDVISELKNAGVSSSKLMAVSESVGEESLSEKTRELAMIYAAYDDALKGVYIDPLDQMEKFYQTAVQYGYFKGKTVYIDAFKGFTGVQLNILKLMISQADSVIISFTAEPQDKMCGVGVFSNINETAELLKRYAKEQNISVLEPIFLTEPVGRDADLCKLEALLAGEQVVPLEAPSEAVSLLRFETPLKELEFVFKTIHRLVRTKGYRYRDFVVIARDISKYERRIALAAEKFSVPCYLDQRRSLMTSPVARFVLSLLRVAVRPSTDSIFSLLKTGFFGLNSDEIARLEEYVFIWNIDKEGWLSNWDMEPRGFVTERPEAAEKTKEQLEDLNSLRKRVMNPICKLRDLLNHPINEAMKALYDTLIALKCDKAVKEYCETLLEKGCPNDADFVMDSWDAVISVLDHMVRCYKDETLEPLYLVQMFELSLSGMTLGTIPRMIDEVSCGSADRIRPGRPRVVFVIGLGLGEFPAPLNEQGILMKSDRLKLEDAGIPILDHFRMFAVEESFLAYTALTCACDRVYATGHRFSFDGSQVEESGIFSRMKKVFHEASIPCDFSSFPETAAEGFDWLASDFDNDNAKTKYLKEIYANDLNYAFRVSGLQAAKLRTCRRLSKDISDRLLGLEIHLSASKIEVYRKCPFSYFCKYILKLGRLQRAELDQLQRGTIVHHVLENVLRDLGEEIALVDSKKLREMIHVAMRAYLEQIRGASYLEVPRFRFLFAEIEKMLYYLISHISAEFKNSDFVPKAFELDISDDGDVPSLRLTFAPNKEVVVTGQIDRVDVFENEENETYVRVIDYKTGKKSFYLSDVLYGLNLQMLLYLHILQKNGGDTEKHNTQAAGILYMPSNRGMIGTDGDDPLVMNGMLLDNDSVLHAMDKAESGRFIPKRPTRARAADPMITAEEFETVFNFVEHQVTDTARKISEGIFDLCPRDGTESTACKYCDFSAVCGLEEDFERLQTKKDNQQVVLEKMREVIGDGNKLD